MKKKRLEAVRNNPVYIKAIIMAAVSVVCFICVYLYDNSRKIDTNEAGEKILERGEAGKDTSYEMEISVNGTEDQIEVPVSPRKYREEELEKIFSDAGKRLEKLILGDNRSLDEIRSDLKLITEIPDSGISVYWELDDYEAMDIQGNLKEENLTEQGKIVKLTSVLSYEEEKAVHEFYIKVYPPELNETEKILSELEKKIEQSNKETNKEKYMILPENINGEKIQWKYRKNKRAFSILILGSCIAGLIIISESQRKKEERKKAVMQMQVDYPQIINKFTLYIRAGMTIRKAWFLIAQDYEKKKVRDRKAYEEMCYTMYQIQGGAPEAEAYEEYGVRCEIAAYRKLGTLLSQNLRKGPQGLSEVLEREAWEAFEDRRSLAKKAGEEAETKLMIPMFAMLIIVFAIVMIPAFFSIQI